jgi:hypothetical protein
MEDTWLLDGISFNSGPGGVDERILLAALAGFTLNPGKSGLRAWSRDRKTYYLLDEAADIARQENTGSSVAQRGSE